MMLPLVDPTVVNWTTLGPESGETNVAAYDDVDDFDGFDSSTLGAPINAQRTTLPDLAAFRQQVTVQKVNPANFDQTWADTSASNLRGSR